MMDIQTSEEQEVIAGCKKNESWARKRLYELYAPTMLGVCIRYTNDRETAKDALQEGFIKAYMKINTFAGTGSFEGWLRRVFMTTALEFLKYSASPEFSTDFTNGEDGELEIDDQVVEKMSAEEIMGCISELPAGCKLIFNLHAVEGYSHSEIAKMLNIKEASSRSQYAYAKRLLQIKIKKLYTHQYAETALESRYR